MFTTITYSPSKHSGKNPPMGVSPSASSPSRKKRAQVSRACHWCRIHRVKCDSISPCSNCKNKGMRCSNEAVTEARTIAQAIKEIENLKTQVKELETQLERRDHEWNPFEPVSKNHTHSIEPPQVAMIKSNQYDGVKKRRDGIHARTARGGQTQWYGPSSVFYFIGRMSTYLRSVLPSPLPDDQIQPNSPSTSFASPIYSKKVILEDNTWTTDASAREEYLTGLQEEYFLEKYWQSYHCTYQILDESEFKEHYKSLWTSEGRSRLPSALVDIVLAICMQYGSAFLPRKDRNKKDKTSVDANDATIAGRWYYHRCQTLLTAELESPSISTLQCHILSVVFLCNASFQNMAHITLGTATRIAHILGLHLEPQEDMPRAQRELRKRIWWTLYTIELKTCMKLGRPMSIQANDFWCTLPADDRATSAISGSSFAAASEDVTWLTYGVQLMNLIVTARDVYLSFYKRCAELMGTKDIKTLYEDNETLETAADFLNSKMTLISEWKSNVPQALKTKRKDTDETFSTDRAPLIVEQFAPLWLQRQRVFLELLYHNLSMNLHRPFIIFPSSDHTPTPLSSQHAIACLNHAMSITAIMHQMLKETEIIHGWHEAFQWQWNATLSTIGFVLAHPNHEITTLARKSLDDAIAVLELLGNHFASAASAAKVACNLTAKAYTIMYRSKGSQDLGDLVLDDGGLSGGQDIGFSSTGTDDFGASMGFAFEQSFEWLTTEDYNIVGTWNLGSS